MDNKHNYNNYFNKNNNVPAEKPNTPAEEIKELDPVTTEGDENTNIEAPKVETEKNEGLDENENPEVDENVTEDEGENNDPEPEEADSETKNVQQAKVVIAKLNIRKEANKNSDIVVEVKKDDLLELTSSTSIDGFYEVKTKDGQNGYCMIDFVELV